MQITETIDVRVRAQQEHETQIALQKCAILADAEADIEPLKTRLSEVLGIDAEAQSGAMGAKQDGMYCTLVYDIDGVQFCLDSEDGALMARAADCDEWQQVGDWAALGRALAAPKKKGRAASTEGAAFPSDYERGAGGLTRREYFAAAALQGFRYWSDYDSELAAGAAVRAADALIEELSK